MVQSPDFRMKVTIGPNQELYIRDYMVDIPENNIKNTNNIRSINKPITTEHPHVSIPKTNNITSWLALNNNSSMTTMLIGHRNNLHVIILLYILIGISLCACIAVLVTKCYKMRCATKQDAIAQPSKLQCSQGSLYTFIPQALPYIPISDPMPTLTYDVETDGDLSYPATINDSIPPPQSEDSWSYGANCVLESPRIGIYPELVNMIENVQIHDEIISETSSMTTDLCKDHQGYQSNTVVEDGRCNKNQWESSYFPFDSTPFVSNYSVYSSGSYTQFKFCAYNSLSDSTLQNLKLIDRVMNVEVIPVEDNNILIITYRGTSVTEAKDVINRASGLESRDYSVRLVRVGESNSF